MKYFPILFLFFWFSSPINIIKSTTQEWKGGQGKTEGVNYTVSIVVKKSSEYIKFNSVVINNKECRFKLLKNKKPLTNNEFNKNDTIIIISSYNYKVENRAKFNKNKLTINYNYKGKEKQEIITEFTKLKTLLYP